MTESGRTRGPFPLALAILLTAGAMTGLLAGLTPAGGSAATYPDAAEIPTDGRRLQALGPAPLGALGAALQVVVVLACPAMCMAMGFLRRFEGRGHPSAAGVKEG